MSLTIGTGPFGQNPGGVFNFELPRRQGLLYFEDFPRRVRAVLAGETVVDSRRAQMLHEHAHLPRWYFPVSEIRTDLLEPSAHTSHCPHKGDATYWSLRVGDRVRDNAVWSYLDPIDGASPLAGYRSFYWDSVDEWWEEDELAIVHPRDPYHRVDVLDSSRHVRVTVAGDVVADSSRTRVIFETGLPPRWYFPPDDVRADLLVPSDRRTGCAYKGFASYHSVRGHHALEEDVVWFYPEPRPGVERIRDRLAFFNERVDLELDGELQERPQTQWSPHAKAA